MNNLLYPRFSYDVLKKIFLYIIDILQNEEVVNLSKNFVDLIKASHEQKHCIKYFNFESFVKRKFNDLLENNKVDIHMGHFK